MNKASGVPAELIQILKDGTISAALNMPANLESSTVVTGLEKVSFHSNSKERQSQRMFDHTGALISQLVRLDRKSF